MRIRRDIVVVAISPLYGLERKERERSPGYIFSTRSVTGSITPENLNSPLTTIKVDGSGTITATFSISTPSVQSSDSSGLQKDQFIPTETIYATGSGYTANYPVNIFVVIHQDVWGDEDVLSDISGGPTSATSTATGVLQTVPAWSSAQPGLYDIIVDANMNNVFDAGDAKDSADVRPGEGGGFLVVPEYFLGGLAALGACFVAFAVFKKRSSLPHFKQL
jgi:hypothetical protein